MIIYYFQVDSQAEGGGPREWRNLLFVFWNISSIYDFILFLFIFFYRKPDTSVLMFSLYISRVSRMRRTRHAWVMVTQQKMRRLVKVTTRRCQETSPMFPPPHHSQSPSRAVHYLTGLFPCLFVVLCYSDLILIFL